MGWGWKSERGIGVDVSRSAIVGRRDLVRATDRKGRPGCVGLDQPLSHAGDRRRRRLRRAGRGGGVRGPLSRAYRPARCVHGADGLPAPAVVGCRRTVRGVRQPHRGRRGRGVPSHPAGGRQPDGSCRHLFLRGETEPGARIRGPRIALLDRVGHARPVRAPQAPPPPAAPRDLHPPDRRGRACPHGHRNDHRTEPGQLARPAHRGRLRAGRAAPRPTSPAFPWAAGWTA